MTDRREVRVASTFFDELDLRLGPERGPDGEPSATDFLVMDLPAIVERFAADFVDRYPPQRLDAYRTYSPRMSSGLPGRWRR